LSIGARFATNPELAGTNVISPRVSTTIPATNCSKLLARALLTGSRLKKPLNSVCFDSWKVLLTSSLKSQGIHEL
jgi:hypothetical protein